MRVALCVVNISPNSTIVFVLTKRGTPSNYHLHITTRCTRANTFQIIVIEICFALHYVKL